MLTWALVLEWEADYSDSAWVECSPGTYCLGGMLTYTSLSV